MGRSEYKLYVWDFDPDYYPGVIVAYARTMAEARKLVLAKDDMDTVREAIRPRPTIYEAGHAVVNWGGG